MSMVRRICSAVVALAVWPLLALPAVAGADGDFHMAVEAATEEFHLAMATLDTRGREETAAAVARFRQAWQLVIERYEVAPAAGTADADRAAFMQVDARIVGAMIVIDVGSREAARGALVPIAETLAQLQARPQQ